MVPIPALSVLGWAILTGEVAEAGTQVEVFGLEVPMRIASLLVGGSVFLLLLAAARSLFALALLLQDDHHAAAAKEAIQKHTSLLNPLFLITNKQPGSHVVSIINGSIALRSAFY